MDVRTRLWVDRSTGPWAENLAPRQSNVKQEKNAKGTGDGTGEVNHPANTEGVRTGAMESIHPAVVGPTTLLRAIGYGSR